MSLALKTCLGKTARSKLHYTPELLRRHRQGANKNPWAGMTHGFGRFRPPQLFGSAMMYTAPTEGLFSVLSLDPGLVFFCIRMTWTYCPFFRSLGSAG